jgi:WD40 repeat protein
MARSSIAGRVRDALRRPLFGPDVFISYSRRNRPYVEKLAARLHEKNKRLTIVTDRHTSLPAESIHPDLTALVRTSSMLVLVLTRNSLTSEHVRSEIVAFREKDRPLVPIDVGDAIEKAWQWNDKALFDYVHSPGVQTEDEASLGDVEKKILPAPSDGVRDAIIDAISFRLQTNRIRWIAGAAAALLVTVALASWYLLDDANRTRALAEQLRDAAVEDRDTARNQAEAAREAASAADTAAGAARNEAAKQLAVASRAETAADAATVLAAQRQQTALGIRMAADSVNVLRQSPYLVETAVRLGVEAMDRLDRAGEHSVAAEIALRDALAIFPEVERERPLPEKTRAIALSADGRFVASAAGAGIVLCPTDEDDCRTIAFEQHELGPPALVAFSGDGAVLAASHGTLERGCIHLHEGEGVSRIDAENDPAILALSRDGSAIAAVTKSGVTAHPSSQKLAVEEVKTLEWSPDGEHLVMTAQGGRTIVWSARNGERTDLPTEHAGRAVFSPDGNSVATIQNSLSEGSAFEPLRIWNWRTKEPRTVGDARPPFASVAFSADGKKLAAAQPDEGLHVYELATGRHVLLPGAPGPFALAADGSRVVVGETPRTSRLWSLTGEPRELARSMDSVTHPLMAMRADGNVVSAVRSDSMRVWHEREWIDQRIAMEHRGPVAAVARDPRSGSLALAVRGKMVARIDAGGVAKPCARLGTPTAMAFRVDGALLVARSGTLQWVRDWCSGAPAGLEESTPAPALDRVLTLATNRDGTVIAVGGVSEAQVYRNGRHLGTIGKGQAARGLALDPTGRYLAIAHFPDPPVHDIQQQPFSADIWDLARPLKEGAVQTIKRPFPVTAMAFDPSGEVLALASGSTVHIYDRWRSEPREIARPDLGDRVSGLAFSLDGSQLTAVGNRGEMLVSRWKPRDLIEVACSAMKKPWPKEEWGAFNGTLPFEPACAR